MPTTQLSIALFDRNLPGSYHWALVISDGPPSGVVLLHQITDTLHGQTKVWQLEPRQTDLADSLGCVTLPMAAPHPGDLEVDIDSETLRQFVAEYAAEQPSAYKTKNGVPWSCARWIMRIVEDLVESGIVALEMEGFYQRVLARGMQLAARRGKRGREAPPTIEF